MGVNITGGAVVKQYYEFVSVQELTAGVSSITFENLLKTDDYRIIITAKAGGLQAIDYTLSAGAVASTRTTELTGTSLGASLPSITANSRYIADFNVYSADTDNRILVTLYSAGIQDASARQVLSFKNWNIGAVETYNLTLTCTMAIGSTITLMKNTTK